MIDINWMVGPLVTNYICLLLELQTMDSILFSYFIFSFILFFTQDQDFSMMSLLLSQLSHDHVIQRRLQKVLEQMISYSIVTTYWSYGKYIYFRVEQLQYAHRPQSVVYKIEQFVLRILLSSFVLLNTKVVFCSYTRF